ncbi:MAG TPA: hypothetical protein VMV46_21900 [Thermoanaerobaculia bacterium]|nr:hypothetical protein [Thermoanaerobaculia bacterium]
MRLAPSLAVATLLAAIGAPAPAGARSCISITPAPTLFSSVAGADAVVIARAGDHHLNHSYGADRGWAQVAVEMTVEEVLRGPGTEALVPDRLFIESSASVLPDPPEDDLARGRVACGSPGYSSGSRYLLLLFHAPTENRSLPHHGLSARAAEPGEAATPFERAVRTYLSVHGIADRAQRRSELESLLAQASDPLPTEHAPAGLVPDLERVLAEPAHFAQAAEIRRRLRAVLERAEWDVGGLDSYGDREAAETYHRLVTLRPDAVAGLVDELWGSRPRAALRLAARLSPEWRDPRWRQRAVEVVGNFEQEGSLSDDLVDAAIRLGAVPPDGVLAALRSTSSVAGFGPPPVQRARAGDEEVLAGALDRATRRPRRLNPTQVVLLAVSPLPVADAAVREVLEHWVARVRSALEEGLRPPGPAVVTLRHITHAQIGVAPDLAFDRLARIAELVPEIIGLACALRETLEHHADLREPVLLRLGEGGAEHLRRCTGPDPARLPSL